MKPKILSVVVALLISAGEPFSIEEEEYVSVCERCTKAAPTYSKLSPHTTNVVKSGLYKRCKWAPDKTFKYTKELESQCKSIVDHVFDEMAKFQKEIARSPEIAAEVCRDLLRCESAIFEEINLRIFKRKRKRHFNLACIECHMAMPEAMKVFENPKFRGNIIDFGLHKFCEGVRDTDECQIIIEHYLLIFRRGFDATFGEHGDHEICQSIGACEVLLKNHQKTFERNFDEL